jgi:ABC-type transport system substrate-binding protein
LGFTSGPKVANFDRVEWLILDNFSAMAALHNGEIDWWEIPLTDQVEALSRDRNITVIPQYATAMGILRFNHLHPPFNNVAVRQALLGAVDQRSCAGHAIMRRFARRSRAPVTTANRSSSSFRPMSKRSALNPWRESISCGAPA